MFTPKDNTGYVSNRAFLVEAEQIKIDFFRQIETSFDAYFGCSGAEPFTIKKIILAMNIFMAINAYEARFGTNTDKSNYITNRQCSIKQEVEVFFNTLIGNYYTLVEKRSFVHKDTQMRCRYDENIVKRLWHATSLPAMKSVEPEILFEHANPDYPLGVGMFKHFVEWRGPIQRDNMSSPPPRYNDAFIPWRLKNIRANFLAGEYALVQRALYDWNQKEVQYFDEKQRAAYRLILCLGRLFYEQSRQVFDTQNSNLFTSAIGTEKQQFGIFVIGPDKKLYAGAQQVGNIHHSSFFNGEPVFAAGEFKVMDGLITRVTGQSGHYMPNPKYLLNFLSWVKKIDADTAVKKKEDGIPLHSFLVANKLFQTQEKNIISNNPESWVDGLTMYRSLLFRQYSIEIKSTQSPTQPLDYLTNDLTSSNRYNKAEIDFLPGNLSASNRYNKAKMDFLPES